MMQVLWVKDKTHIPKKRALDKASATIANACGDSYVHCRVCARACSLRRLRDTCQISGVDVTYEQLLGECFGVKVTSPDDVICSACVTQLLRAQDFKQRVISAFENRPIQTTSRSTSQHSQQHLEIHPNTIATSSGTSPDNTNMVRNNILAADDFSVTETIRQSAAEPTNKMAAAPKQERKPYTDIYKPNVMKKTIVKCVSCGHKYPTVFKSNTTPPQAFICARCNLKNSKRAECRKCRMNVPARQMREYLEEEHAKKSLQGKLRQRSLNDSQVISVATITSVPSYKGQNASLKAYRDTLMALCKICGKSLGTRILFEEHMRIHSNGTQQPNKDIEVTYESPHSIANYENMDVCV